MFGFSLTKTFIVGILIAILFFLQYQLWFASDGINDLLRLKKMSETQAKENEALKKRNDELMFQVKRLQNSDEETESRARSELGMIKKNETFYQVVTGSNQ